MPNEASTVFWWLPFDSLTSTNNFFAAKDYGILDYDVVKESGGKTTVYDLHHTEVPPRSGYWYSVFHFCLVAKTLWFAFMFSCETQHSLRFSLIVIKWTELDWFCDHTNWCDPVTRVRASEPTWLNGHSKNLQVRMGGTQRWCWPAHTYNTSTIRTKTSTPSVTWRYPNSRSWCL